MSDKAYFDYLTKRSILSKLYRNFILYPVLSREFDGKVLDVGCGIGDFLKFRANTIGVDINPYNVDYCAKNKLEAYLIQNGKYPFEGAFFDGVILDNVLEHLSIPDPTINEISRVLKSKGILIIGVPGTKGYTMDSDHKKFYDEESLRELLQRNGFKLKKYIHGPLMMRSKWLSKTISQYCLYGVFIKD